MRMKKVLATSWHPGGINAIVPVIKRLREDAQVDVEVLGHEYSAKILERAGLGYKTLEDYNLEGVSVDEMGELVSAVNPDVVLTGTSTQDDTDRDVLEQTVTLAARRQGVPTIAVLDFWANYARRFSDVYSGEQFKFLPDRIAIMDRYALVDMVAEGFDSSRLVVTGNPFFDNLESRARQFSGEDRQQVRDRCGVTNELMFFYAGNAFKNRRGERGYWDGDNLEALDVLKDCSVDVVVKMHPRAPAGDEEEVDAYVAANEFMTRVKDGDAQELVLASDVVLTPFSTVAFEAVYMGRPCISMQPGRKGPDYVSVLTKNRLIPAGYTRRDCEALVRSAVLPEFRAELRERAKGFRTDGNAADRVAKVVYDALGEGRATYR